MVRATELYQRAYLEGYKRGTPKAPAHAAVSGCTGTGELRYPGFGWHYADHEDRVRPETCTATTAVLEGVGR